MYPLFQEVGPEWRRHQQTHWRPAWQPCRRGGSRRPSTASFRWSNSSPRTKRRGPTWGRRTCRGRRWTTRWGPSGAHRPLPLSPPALATTSGMRSRPRGALRMRERPTRRPSNSTRATRRLSRASPHSGRPRRHRPLLPLPPLRQPPCLAPRHPRRPPLHQRLPFRQRRRRLPPQLHQLRPPFRRRQRPRTFHPRRWEPLRGRNRLQPLLGPLPSRRRRSPNRRRFRCSRRPGVAPRLQRPRTSNSACGPGPRPGPCPVRAPWGRAPGPAGLCPPPNHPDTAAR